MAIVHEKVDHEPKLEFRGPFGSGPRETVADIVRRARKDIGQDLRSVADVLRIRLAYLEAIESGEFDRLPGTTYAVGFLRTYADYLGLDGEDMVERFKAETQAAERRSELIFPEPVAEGRIPGGAIIFVSVILLAVAYGGWFYLSQQGRTVADLIPAWPSQTATETDQARVPAAPAQSATPDTQSPAPMDATAETAAPQAKAPETKTPETKAPETKTPEAKAPEAKTPEAQVPVVSVPKVAAPAPVPVPAPAPASPPAADTARAAPAPETTAAPGAAAAETDDTAPEPPTLTTQAEMGNAPATEIIPAPAPEPVPAPTQETADLAAANDPTVLIPAPPTAPETVIIPDDRSPRVYGSSNDESRIVIRAVQDSWVQVRDPQDAILLTRVLRAGDSYRVPNVEGLTLLTGNAGGIELEVDGVRLPPAGPPGSVRRSIALDPARLLAGTANR